MDLLGTLTSGLPGRHIGRQVRQQLAEIDVIPFGC